MPSWITAQLVVSVVTIAVMIHVMLICVAYFVMMERKVSAYIQDRIGPNRVGFDFGLPALKFLKGCIGLGQPLADGVKFILKEDYTPNRVDKVLFTRSTSRAPSSTPASSTCSRSPPWASTA
jgi:NADH-quinone oxidoreductase subunit H